MDCLSAGSKGLVNYSYFDALPVELLLSVFSRLPFYEQGSVSLVCRRFRNVVQVLDQRVHHVKLVSFCSEGAFRSLLRRFPALESVPVYRPIRTLDRGAMDMMSKKKKVDLINKIFNQWSLSHYGANPGNAIKCIRFYSEDLKTVEDLKAFVAHFPALCNLDISETGVFKTNMSSRRVGFIEYGEPKVSRWAKVKHWIMPKYFKESDVLSYSIKEVNPLEGLLTCVSDKLIHLDYSWHSLSEAEMQRIVAAFPNLKRLVLAYSHLWGIGPDCEWPKSLEFLDLSGCEGLSVSNIRNIFKSCPGVLALHLRHVTNVVNLIQKVDYRSTQLEKIVISEDVFSLLCQDRFIFEDYKIPGTNVILCVG